MIREQVVRASFEAVGGRGRKLCIPPISKHEAPLFAPYLKPPILLYITGGIGDSPQATACGDSIGYPDRGSNCNILRTQASAGGDGNAGPLALYSEITVTGGPHQSFEIVYCE